MGKKLHYLIQCQKALLVPASVHVERNSKDYFVPLLFIFHNLTIVVVNFQSFVIRAFAPSFSNAFSVSGCEIQRLPLEGRARRMRHCRTRRPPPSTARTAPWRPPPSQSPPPRRPGSASLAKTLLDELCPAWVEVWVRPVAKKFVGCVNLASWGLFVKQVFILDLIEVFVSDLK